MTRERVAMVGPGGVGSVFAAHLSAVHDVVGCARRPFDRYVIESPEVPFDGPAHVVTDPADLSDEPYDWVLVALKAHQTAGAAAWLEQACGPDTTVVGMQNGVEAVERLSPYVNGAHVIPSVVYCGAELIEPGHVRHSRSMRLIVPDDEPGARLAELFEATPAQIDPSPGHRTSAWVKLAINVVANGITALTGRDMRVLRDDAIAPVAAKLMTEVLTVGRADGVELDLDGIPDRIAAMGTNPVRTSMLQDTDAGRTTEHDAIHGAVLRAGARHGIDTPVTEVVHALLAARSA